jgi:ACT domain-containing protein
MVQLCSGKAHRIINRLKNPNPATKSIPFGTKTPILESNMKAIITVVGKDRVGIIAAVSAKLAACGVNILDISQTIMQENFTMMMSVDLARSSVSLKELKAQLAEIGSAMGLVINIYNEELFNSMHRV